MKQMTIVRVALLIFLAISFFSTETGYAQAGSTDATAIELDDLKTPTSPAFVLLGVSPSSIERPTTPKAVAANLFSSFASSDLVPDNYALELAPYWLKSRPQLEFSDYYENHSILETFRRYLSISVATSKRQPDPDSATFVATSIGFGFRSRIVEGVVSDRLKNKYREKEKLVKLNQIPVLIPYEGFKVDSLHKLEEKYIDFINKVMPPSRFISYPGISDKELTEYLQQLKDRINNLFDEAKRNYAETEIQEVKREVNRELQNKAFAELKSLAQEIQGLSKERLGLIWEIAGGLSLDFPANEFEAGSVNKVGIWSTWTYRWSEPFVDASLLTRVMTEDKPGEDNFLFDIGGKLNYSYNRFSLAAEFVRRSIITGKLEQLQPDLFTGTFTVKSSSRITGELEYKLKDGLYLTSTFGKDYERVGNVGDLIAQIGLNFGFGQKIKLK